MVQTFILTRSFAISALVVGAFPVAYAAPVPKVVVHEARHDPRGCRLMGCLYALPTGQEDTNATNSASVTTSQTTLSTDSLQVIDFLISTLTSARNSLSSSSTSTSAVTVDAVVPSVDIGEDIADHSFAEELAASLSSDMKAPSPPPVAEATVPTAEVTPAENEAASLDALV
ncbi:hypothetical protein DICSQDRAFT_161931 [Dichomitus squalens LYAD-421 SS1]|uniref:Uncharacterized protein n=1 Tax=Dichomitus squalens (strain LYAD-421) TaxID=732165 RepID=R7SXD9_DICSQ|nr:uncharacterized protein DICSQDRAFT_161931 [Dichomitus squalens LYAD-421 SS1]EJF60746.1 hypothetical protein DICSQDRAFT_161931 [Dichomitus squalens LYAD-421 SS1]